MSDPVWYPSAEFLAQGGHFLIGLLCVILPLAFFPGWKYGALYGGIAALVYMILKEFTFDLIVEKDTVANGFRDLWYLTLGVLSAFAFYGIVVAIRFYPSLYR